jgi:phosphatidylglycerol:prolipoprotein diacylglycerol transferase
MYALGILAAAGLSEHLYRRRGGRPGVMADMVLPVMIGVILGARALFILVEREYYIQNPLEILMVWKGGLVFYGGLIGGALAFVLTTRLRRLPLWEMADILAPGVALGHALGRLGCFFAGSCYGRPTNLPWAVTYTNPNSLAGDILGVPVHPTQLYSAPSPTQTRTLWPETSSASRSTRRNSTRRHSSSFYQVYLYLSGPDPLSEGR